MKKPELKTRLFRGYILPYWRELLFGLLVSLFTVALNVAVPYISRFVIDGLTGGTLTRQDLVLWLLLYAAAAAVAAVLSWWMRSLPLRVGHSVETRIRGNLFDHLTELDRGFYQKRHTGDLMNRLSSDVQALGMGIGQGFMQNGRMVFVFIMTFTVMFRICASLALGLMLMVPLMVLSFSWFARRIKRGHLAVQEQLSRLSSFNQEAFTGIQTLKSFAVEPRWRDLFRKQNTALMNENMRLAYVHDGIHPLAALWFGASSLLILLAGGRFVIQGRMTLGELVQFTQYLMYMQWPLLSLGWILSLIQRSRASWGRIRSILEEDPVIAEPPSAECAVFPGRCDIRFEEVTLERGGIRLLDRVSLEIPAGTRIGITGPTGSGKTLLVSLLPRLLDPDSGSVKLGGVDLRKYSLKELRARIGMAEQEPTLFSDTLANNIGFGVSDPTEEMILTVADIAHLHADVEQLPQGYETLIGERGISLSGGQRQRTSISRAISRKPDLLILDDVLASVDTETEAAILNKLRPVLADRTTLLVSHRISTLIDMDSILVLEDGRITQQGTHDELLAQPGYYRRLHDMQLLAATG